MNDLLQETITQNLEDTIVSVCDNLIQILKIGTSEEILNQLDEYIIKNDIEELEDLLNFEHNNSLYIEILNFVLNQPQNDGYDDLDCIYNALYLYIKSMIIEDFNYQT